MDDKTRRNIFMFLLTMLMMEEDMLMFILLKKKRITYYYSPAWFQNIVLCNDVQYKKIFRYSKATIDSLFNYFTANTMYNNDKFREYFLVFIYFSTRKISFFDLGTLFGVPASTLHYNINIILEQILKKYNNVIYLPEVTELQRCNQLMLAHSSCPNTVLAVDGTHVSITNVLSHNRYIDRCGKPTLSFMCVVDGAHKFRYIFGPCYGSNHDSNVYKSSLLPEWAERNLNYQDVQYHIVGDAAYPGSFFIKKPFAGTLNNEQKLYNNSLLPQRRVVEKVYGYFKGVFQKFRHENAKGDRGLLGKFFYACAIIHNLTIDDMLNNIDEEERQLYEEVINEERDYQENIRRNNI